MTVGRGLLKKEQQKILKRAVRLIPALSGRGLAPEEALAVAYNAVFVFYGLRRKFFLLSPKQVLKRYSYPEIALLCESLLEPEGVEAGFDFSFRKAATK